MNLKQEIKEELELLRSNKSSDFSSNLTKTKYPIYGIKIQSLKDIAKRLVKENKYIDYLDIKVDLFEEIQIQFFILGYLKDYNFITNYIMNNWYKVDNWAICDSTSSFLKKVVIKNIENFKLFLKEFYNMNYMKTFYARLVIVMIMNHYIKESMSDDELIAIFSFFEKADAIDTYDMGTYYVKMAISWAIQFAYVKKHDITYNYLVNNPNLCNFTYNKAIQKMIESFKISNEDKDLLRKMKRK